MKRMGGVSLIPCKINGLGLSFIFDTGASDVTISLTEASFMLKNGYLNSNDIIDEPTYYSDANGDISEGISINLRVIEIQGLKLYNVKASIVKNLDAPLLLGQSALSKLGTIQFNLNENVLTIFPDKNISNRSYTNSKKNQEINPRRMILRNGLDSLSYAAGISIASNMKSQNINQLKISSFSRAVEDVNYLREFEMTFEKSNEILQKGLQNIRLLQTGDNFLDLFSYAAGLNIAYNMKLQGLNSINSYLLVIAIEDFLNDKTTLFDQEQANLTLQEKLQEFAKKKAEGDNTKCQQFLDNNKKRVGVISLANGLQYEIIKSGEPNGMKPTPVDTVVVDYIGTLIDGTEFDNSIKRGEPASFPLIGVIRGWTEILQLMTRGAHWKVYIPSYLAYGERGAGGAIPPNAALIFEITLRDIKPAVTK